MIKNMQPHIRCADKDTAEFVILPGDPARVEIARDILDDPTDIAFNREYKSISGYYKGLKVLVVSTGIGGPSIGIAVEELKNIGVKTLIRIGSCGALQDNIKLGDLIIANGVVRNDGLSDTYIEKGYPAVPDPALLFALQQAAEELDYSYHTGLIRSHDSFYTDRENEIDQYWSAKGILGSDMESSALFVIGGLRGLQVASILNVVVDSNGNLEEGINDYVDGLNATVEGEKREIITALEAIALNNKN